MTANRSSRPCYEGPINELDISGWNADVTNGKQVPAPKTGKQNNPNKTQTSNQTQQKIKKQPSQPVPNNNSHWDNLPQMLRAFGGLTLLAAVTIYLFQGSQTDNELFRYFLLLGHTVCLTILGFFSGRTLSDSKGARTLVALALASVPANFAILGGFIRSQFIDLDNANTVIPTALTWTADSLSGALIPTAAALVFLMPVIYVGFLVLCRPLATGFSALFLIGNVAMLIPMRSPLFIAALVAVVGFLIVRQTYMSRKRSTHLATFEGGIAQLILIAPLAVIVGRSLWIYGVDNLLMITVTGLMLGFMRFTQQNATWELAKKVLEPVRLILSILMAISVGDLIGNDLLSDTAFIIPFAGLIFVGLMWDLSRTSDHEPWKHCYVQLGIWSWALLMGFNLFANQTVIIATFAAMVGIIMLVYAVIIESKIGKLGGTALLAAGLICQLSNLMAFFSLGGWGSLALLGVIAILGSSLIEKQGGRLKWLFLKGKTEQ